MNTGMRKRKQIGYRPEPELYNDIKHFAKMQKVSMSTIVDALVRSAKNRGMEPELYNDIKHFAKMQKVSMSTILEKN